MSALLGLCRRQQQEISRLTQERAELEERNRALIAERDQFKQQNEELSRRLPGFRELVQAAVQ